MFSPARTALSLILAFILALMLPTPSNAQQARAEATLKAYFFGNSLMHHLEGLPQTSTPYWLNKIAEARGGRLQADGTWGFLRNFAGQLPPEPNWQIGGVRGVWSERLGSFADAGVNTVVLNPANFIQYQPPSALYDSNNPNRDSPVTATLKVFDWVREGVPAAAEQPRFFIYEGWADMVGYSRSFPPSKSELNQYLADNQTGYHDWYEDYVTALQRARPNLQVTLLPVASTLPEILALPALEGLTATDLFSDDAPHGTATVYFLAAFISYSALFQDDLPAQMLLPDSIHPLVRQNYGQIAEALWDSRAKTLRPPSTQRRDQARDSAPPAVPALAMGLNGISDWSTQMPFIDVMKSARPWVGHLPDQWGGMSFDTLRAEGHLSDEGWPLRIPKGVEQLETFILADLPSDARDTAGRYRLTYRGKGNITLLGRAQDIRARTGEIWFNFTPGEGLVAVTLRDTDPKDPIRDIQVIHERHLPFWEMGAVFNPDWLRQIEDMRVLRFMDWMATNHSPISQWDQRPLPTDYTYAWRGVPIEVMLQLANQVGADPWLNMPHMADDGYVRRFAEMVQRDLDPGLKAYVEYSNEVWNHIFTQAKYATEQAAARWRGASGNTDGWMQWAGVRAAEVADIWAEVFGAEAETRLTRVIAVHTGWPGLEEAALEAPLFMREARGNIRPGDRFDAYAVTGYFGYELGADPQAAKVLDWLKISESEALKRSYKWLQSGEVKRLTQEVFPYHAGVARSYGMDLIMYEGGTHIVGHEGWVNDEALTAFFIKLNYSQEMAALYADVLQGWQDAGGTLFNAFVDVAAASKWGSWGGLRHLSDNNPRWAVIQRANTSLSTDWESRDPQAFRRGIARAGGDADNLLEGTALRDVLVGADGDDWLISRGGADALHGGAGVDTAVLRGAATDYQFSWASSPVGDFLIADGPEGEVTMRGIEQLEFSAAPGQLYRVSPRQ
ncbi:hypothetical protein TL5118_01832 [Thalassovita autumnalis]|uniref:Calcium-binding protein n=1 Tax=Thalassovita autumnalis TaxID=2072972 RepID=A0A0N7LX95_9RHOB|nr:hypothetical protein [Thalassovita autumnalis]CUH66586.1 hypothetical protein TL5118_01832 [Thalassovita autumnalis]CUH71279.1 hypothetical protein TL5120_01065 [Thalassovita autumnalis]